VGPGGVVGGDEEGLGGCTSAAVAAGDQLF